MCDTFVALGNASRDGSVIFGKNSDREPNEAQELVIIPRASHPEGAQTTCTYLTIPQVRETHAVLLSKPFWIWGAEMGANEHGVVIGNEAVFTKVPYDKSPGLMGMDILRLALERSSSADEALDVMIKLLETYGQGGNHGFSHHLFYHNSFLIADRHHRGWVFETAGRHWAAEKIHDARSISNVISIGSKWDRASDNLVSHALEKGWCKDPEEFNFSDCYSDLIYTKFSAGQYRACRTQELLNKHLGEIDVPFAMRLLRDHGQDVGDNWQPSKGLTGAEVCNHASFGPVRVSQTTGSMISHLTSETDTHWVTGTSAPCTSIFKPIWIDSGLPDLGPSPTGIYDQATLWWQHENLHRAILRDYAFRIKEIALERDSLEASMIEKVGNLRQNIKATRTSFSNKCFSTAYQEETAWLIKIQDLPIQNGRSLLDRIAWKKFDKLAQRN